jgi:hypothetical protein
LIEYWGQDRRISLTKTTVVTFVAAQAVFPFALLTKIAFGARKLLIDRGR